MRLLVSVETMALFAALSVGCGGASSDSAGAASPQGGLVGRPAPDFAATSMANGRGKVAASGLRVVGVSEDEADDKSKIPEFATTYGAKFTPRPIAAVHPDIRLPSS